MFDSSSDEFVVVVGWVRDGIWKTVIFLWSEEDVDDVWVVVSNGQAEGMVVVNGGVDVW